ncbi:unnamed protein product [Spirodela intermedia]|uniref:EF-hand domain-containing protein n=1 Tax=Spirodela intermedia TaxID=51605 RepID=A0A7I8J737_SPIIN|nr:unnamed protein product [Spirodela intermedia]CAA6665213.1 unnamed protein product [Spirodela intermedia]
MLIDAVRVSPFCFVDAVRDYMSLTKRYPRLSLSPEFSKVVFNWAKEKLNISLYTPVSFQHEFEVDAEQKDLKHNVVETQKSKSDSTVWNAKVILMSGISVEALEELNAEQNSDDRISHINNLLKFAILRKDHSFTAIGGPWNATLDGGDPSTDNTSLVQTAKRYLKDLTQLDLGNCQHWNEFIKIHYDRIGKDGLLSHKEITVLYLPDLSNCLPSIDQWRSQWLAHKMMVAEKEQFAEKQKKLSEKDLSQGDRKHEISEVAVDVGNDIKVKVEDGRASMTWKKAVDMDTGGMSTADDRQSIKEGEVESIKETTSDMENIEDGASAPAIVDTRKNADKMGETDDENKQGHLEGAVKRDETSLSVTNVRTFVRKKVTKKIPEKTPEKEDQILETFNVQTEKMAEMEPEVLKADVKDEQEGASGKEAVPKTAGKKKVIRKVIKKKIIKLDEKREIAGSKQDGKADPEVEATVDSGINKSGDRGGNECKELGIVKQDDCGATDGKENKEDKEDEEKTIPDDQGTVETHVAKQEDLKKHGENDRREKDKDEKKPDSKQKTGKESNEKKPEVAPGNPGLFVRTKQTTESKIRSISLSLDGLLDYNEKDTEESTVELSLFAESLNEMIQFEMGSRLLSFLQKLRSNCLAKRNKQKREREETAEKNEKESSAHKRLKSVDDNKVENEWAQSMAQSSSTLDNASQIAKDENSAHGLDESTAENKEEQVMEVQEDLKEAEEMDETPPENVAAKQARFISFLLPGSEFASASPMQEEIPGEKVEPEEKADGLPEQEVKGEDGKSTEEGTARHDTERGTAREDDPGKKEHAPEVVNGDLLQAFRYFDRNRVGYIKVEDLRLIIHNLGLFLSQKEVKELVQSALLESSSSRDNRVMYHKLVRMGGLLS